MNGIVEGSLVAISIYKNIDQPEKLGVKNKPMAVYDQYVFQ